MSRTLAWSSRSSVGGEGVVGVEQWAELRREHFVHKVSINELVRRTGRSRNTIRAVLRSPVPPRYSRAPAGSKLDPFKDEIHGLLKDDPLLTGRRIRELIAPLGFGGGKTIVDDYLREVRPLSAGRAPISARSIGLGRSASSMYQRGHENWLDRERPAISGGCWRTSGRASGRSDWHTAAASVVVRSSRSPSGAPPWRSADPRADGSAGRRPPRPSDRARGRHPGARRACP